MPKYIPKKTALFLVCVIIALSAAVPVNAAKNAKTTVSVTISAAGDCTLGVDSRYNSIFDSYYAANGDDYFLKKVRSIFGQDDLTIVNFEGTLTESTQRADKKFTFKGPAEYVNILKDSSVEVANIANNHTLDFGESGYLDTVQTLKENGIAYCGRGKICYKRVNGVKVAFLGFNALGGVSCDDVKSSIRTAKSKKAKIIIVSFHWGIERTYAPTTAQETLGRCAIDEGASLVLGHHPHVLQGIENYKGRYIVYSLGNFCFGGNSNPPDKDTMIFRQTFYFQQGRMLQENRARVVPCSLSSSASHNDFQPVILQGAAKKSLLEKLEAMSQGRNVSFGVTGMLAAK